MTSEFKTVNILITGASGYLGQHLLHLLMHRGPPSNDLRYKITALYNSSSENFPRSLLSETVVHHPNVQVIPKQCNLVTYNTPDTQCYDICIHCAALANPRACQNDPDKAMAINVPLSFLKATQHIPLMIVLSTDQVYDGRQTIVGESNGNTHQFYQEDSVVNPLNVYAESKVQLERVLQEIRGSNNNVSTQILRSSIMVGPKVPFSPEDAHDTFLHFCASRENQETQLWTNEYRTIVSVDHVCNTIVFFIDKKVVDTTVTNHPYENSFNIFNMGGTIRVNRHDIAKAVFEHFGFDTGCLLEAKQISPTVPLDISMDSTKLFKTTCISHKPSTLKALVEYTFAPKE